MAAKLKSNPLNGMHTAGIFADLSVDGPEIGTLVLIADRAKNLPNRKTIGKQDPYCAARLGKEAKKTTTDIRGGQTPKWDQELRFVVHDSPDYYQLKLSIFNDDKKTDLIGETWVDLRDIIVSGGGQSDQWQNLNFKGKYAGEVRIELTFYDSRPKPEKPAAKPKPVASGSEHEGQGELQSVRIPVKRRPLPSNPGSEHALSPKAAPDHVQTPPRAQPHPPATSFVPNQSPLQAVEYQTPPSARYNKPEHYSPAPDRASQYGTSPRPRPEAHHHRSLDKNDKFTAYETDLQHQADPYSQSYEAEARSSYSLGQPAYETPSPPISHQRQAMPDDDCPPPPPAHRSRNNTGNSHDILQRGSLEPLAHKATPPMRHDVLRNEAHRQSVSSPSSNYPGRPTYRPYESAPDVSRQLTYNETSPPRHHSYDSAFESHSRSLQPTVEDVPESWTLPNARSGPSTSYQEQYDELHFNQNPSPAPLKVHSRGVAAPGQYTLSPVHSQRAKGSIDYGSPASAVALREYPRGDTRHSYSGQRDPYAAHVNDLETTQAANPDNYAQLPPVPSNLVPGIDPSLAVEVATRVHERRYTQPAPVCTPTRGRQHSEPPNTYGALPSLHVNYAGHPRNYGGSPVTYSSGPNTPPGPAPVTDPYGHSPNPTRHSPSPNPNHTIKRKSVSPAPPPDRQDCRRLSGVPFGPDSYDELNPSVAAAKEAPQSSEYTNAYGKIVTSDGREVDPSDHLPMDTWAPEPKPKQPLQKAAEPQPRPTPVGAQPMPPSGRRQLRIAGGPQSMAAAPPTYIQPEIQPSPPPSTGRNRLQKKAHRVSAAPPPTPVGSSPLGPATSHQRNSTPPRALIRASTFDHENYGHPYGGSPGDGPRVSDSGPPVPAKVPMMSGGLGPFPGKAGGDDGGGGDDWALMEEMSRIDLGNGRARRHGGY